MAPRPQLPAELLSAPFTVEDALRAGLTRKQLRGCSWRRLATGMYAWSELAVGPTQLLRAVHRRLPPGAVFSGRTAAWLHGLDLPPCDPVEVALPAGSSIRARAGLSIRRSNLGQPDVAVRHGLAATSPPRTLFDLACRLRLCEAVVVADMALRRGVVDLEEFLSFAESQRRRRGITQARRVLDLVDPAAESPMETRLRLLLVLADLPRPVPQVAIRDRYGRFLGRIDLYYPDHRLGLEYDGGTHRESLVTDNRRQNRLLAAGIRLLRFTAADVYKTPNATVALVRAALARGA